MGKGGCGLKCHKQVCTGECGCSSQYIVGEGRVDLQCQLPTV